MEQRAQTLWSDWSPPVVSARAASVPPVEDDIAAYVRSMAQMLHADDALLTLHVEPGAPSILDVVATGSVLAQAAQAQVAAQAGPRSAGVQGWASPALEPEWSSCMLDGRMWHILGVPVWSRRARSCVVLSLLFKTASLADRSRTTARLHDLRPVVEPFLRQWQRTRLQNRAAAGFRDALDSVEMGVMMIDRGSKIVFANTSATTILSATEPLRRIGESFTASDVRQAVPLQVALSHAIADNGDDRRAGQDEDGGRRASVVALRSQRLGRSLVLSVVPAEQRATEPFDVAAIVYIIDPKLDTTKQLQPVCALFGLSPVETRLVCLLTAGQTLQDAAVAMRIKDQTARSYLKQVFSKTDTRRQADLVRVMLCSLLRTERMISPVTLKAAN